MKKSLYNLSVLFILFYSVSFAQSIDTIMVAFWNQENLFDTIDDPDKRDEEFLPDGNREWTEDRLDIKLYHHARVIRSMNNNRGPDILGVCEVEHQSLLDSLISKYLKDKPYQVSYIESPDNRGIDNGLIYNSEKFKLLGAEGDTVHLEDNWPTRLVLKVTLLYRGSDTLYVFVNHWPSRSRGREKSEPNRIKAAQTLRNSVNKIFNINPDAKIIIIGDFNDEPVNISILDTLRAYPFNCDTLAAGVEFETAGELFNASYSAFENGLGTYKYRDDWNLLDQVIISGSLLTDSRFHYICNSFEIYKPYFIVTHHGKYKGTPFPTFGGRRYLGGYSDHFPVMAKFVIK